MHGPMYIKFLALNYRFAMYTKMCTVAISNCQC